MYGCRIVYKRKKRKKRLIVFLSVCFLIVIIFCFHYFFYMVPTIKIIAEEELRLLATTSVGKAAAETVTDAYSYSDLIEVTKNSNGDIVLLQANSTLIHVLIRTAAAKAQQYIAETEELNLSIPLGTLSGIALLSGYGPKVKINVLPIGIISTQVESEFVSVGINQTLHKIYIKIRADITMILPGLESRISSYVHIPIAESTIIGKVPDVYFNSGLFEKVLNLVP